MALARTRSVALVGVSGLLVEVEADLTPGVPGFTIVGLPDASVNESRDRVRAAIINSGEQWPMRRIIVGLSPASVHKRGSGFDLAVACAILAAAGALPPDQLSDLALLGELGLDGRVRPVCGVLPSVLAVARAGFATVAVPSSNLAEAELVPGVEALGVSTLGDLLAVLRGDTEPGPACPPDGPAGDGPKPDKQPLGGAEPVAGASDGGSPPPPPVALTVSSRRPLIVRPATGGDRAGERVSPEGAPASASVAAPSSSSSPATPPDLADVHGQVVARRALEICAAGGHHLFLCGPPGAGKTMLAERLPGLLPPLDRETALEVTAIHSAAGVLPPERPLITRPPFCAPHHTASLPALVGGGSHSLRPGAVSLAHRGVLFLDEAPEFGRPVLDSLRQPLESGEVVVARLSATVSFPARFLLVLGANPCPCGQSSGKGLECRCSPMAKRRYLGRLSGPLLDRIDVQVEVYPVSRAELLEDSGRAESTMVVADRVRQARERAGHRLAGTPWRTNAEVPGRELRSRWRPEPSSLSPASTAMDRGRLTARGFDRLLRVAWTIADLNGHARPTGDDVAAALFFRSGAVAAVCA